MKRTKFLLAFAGAVALPGAYISRAMNRIFREAKGFKIKAGEGRYHGHIQLKGVNANIQDVKISGKDTDGDLAIFEQTSLSPKRGTPLHLHHAQDEIFYILEGEYIFQIDKERHKLKAGDSIFLPRKVPHAWTQMSDRGKMTVIVQPAGKLEEFFVALASYKGQPTPEDVGRLFGKHEMQVIGPPLKIN